MNEFDVRQLNIMIQKINAFNNGYLELSNLINDLEALLNILTIQDQHWKDLFKGYWWDLEQVYAVAIDEERSYLDSEDQSIIKNAVENIKKMVEIKLLSH